MHAQQKPLASRQVIERIQSHVGVPWHSETVDTFKAGNPDAPVTGIAVTMMATLDVLQRAVESGNNLIITHEPTFFDHLDTATDIAEGESDPVLAAKRAFIEKRGLIIWRFHDHWHARKPDGIEAGMLLAGNNFRIPRTNTFSSCPPRAWPISLPKLRHGYRCTSCMQLATHICQLPAWG